MTRTLREVTFWLLWLLVFTIPLEAVVMIGGLGTISRGVGLLATASAATTVLLTGRRYRAVDTHLLAGAFTVWVALSIAWSNDQSRALTYTITMAQLLVLLLLLWEFGQERQANRRLLEAYVLGAAGSCLSAFLTFLRTASEDGVNRFAAAGFNENDFALVVAAGVPMAWWLSLTGSTTWSRMLARGYLPLAVIGVALSGSRGSLVALLVALTVVPLTLRAASMVARVTTLAVLFVGALALVTVVPPATLARLATTPQELTSGNLSDRTLLWEAAGELIAEHPWIGLGVGGGPEHIEARTGINLGPHNAYLSVTAETGVVGMALFLLVVLSVLLRTLRLPAPDRACMMVLLVTLLVGLIPAHREYYKLTWLIFAFVLARSAPLIRDVRAGLVERLEAQRTLVLASQAPTMSEPIEVRSGNGP